MVKEIKVPELLVPANNLNILRYAVEYGADAVYIGGRKFNLRSLGENFTLAELKKGIDYAHARGVKVYFTLNSVIFDHELKELKEYLNELKRINFDAVIVSDFGAIESLKEVIPDAKLHISTQVNTLNHLGVRFWENLGASRVNLARETKFSDLKNIIRNTNIEIEVFVHGALCISYSGRCMLSKYMAGRDANRGECAHSCRWKYYLLEEERPNLFFPIEQDVKGTHIYNSRDLCLLAKLKLLADTGVDCFKIEGRMKTENYVSLTTWVYRRALEYIKQNKFTRQKISYLMRELSKTSHRNFTEGFMFLDDYRELEENDSVHYVNEYKFVGVSIGHSKRHNGPLIKVKNQFKQHGELDMLQPYIDPIKFKITKIILRNRNKNNNGGKDKEISCANPNDTVVIPDLGNVSPFAIFRVKA